MVPGQLYQHHLGLVKNANLGPEGHRPTESVTGGGTQQSVFEQVFHVILMHLKCGSLSNMYTYIQNMVTH